MFAFVPKRGEFVAHVLAAPTPAGREFAAEWHNRPVQRNAFEGVAKQYMFARFAQAVFMLLKPFVAFSPMGKYVARLQARAGEMDEYEVRREWLSGKALQDLYSGGGSRKVSESPSSRKRCRSQTSTNEEEEDGEWEWPPQKNIQVDPWAEISDGGECKFYSMGLTDSEEGERGRPRKRRQGCSRSEHTMNTLPSLTDTSMVDIKKHLDGSRSGSHPPGLPRPLDYFLKDGLMSENRGEANTQPDSTT